MDRATIAIIGGGAAGIFACIAAARAAPKSRIVVLEKTRHFLNKVSISGGGRCNVTHNCFDPKLLVQNYPRGGKALLGPFSRFQPRDTIEWFEREGVKLKAESDGRIFPCSDNSATIVNCLLDLARARGVELRSLASVKAIEREGSSFVLKLADGEAVIADRLLLASGSSKVPWQWLAQMGHTIKPPVPSLFTFNCPSSPLLSLAGITVGDVSASIENTSLHQRGALLITHWGFSGPAILKLSAWGARHLQQVEYRAQLNINWLPSLSPSELREKLQSAKRQHPSRYARSSPILPLPLKLWKMVADNASLPASARWSTLSNLSIEKFSREIEKSCFAIEGKSTNKDEFVTCGGVALEQVNFKTMESKICPNLYLAGEILDIDGVTGGFNFQSAWTTGWLAGNAMALK